MNILLVEDDKRISEFIVKGLEEKGMHVQLASSGDEARKLILNGDWDLILMDIMLPDIDGIQLTKMIRFKKDYTPILMLSALSDTTDKIDALDGGADDYLTKPFHFSELLSRINALTRRTKFNYENQNKSYNCGDLQLDPEKHIVSQGGKIIDLSPKEYKLLLYLLENKGRVISRTQILEQVWGIQYDTNTNVVDVYISYIRNKIDETEGKLIHTIKGTGYMLQE
ncbi:response regulator transcription factor [Myroides sp. 1354]|uniref:response regulator transcription factor n=1 Tax=unclassified Myroides TaxID=2642485 RepID=UPI002576F3D6|nr:MULTISPECIES: response regulator transcription factor [unclassified Myroides]MDM1044889.1 response regulator transcription factor [Myroides sp. R163-1]MDM1055602.1 response regulator transcription factor [Myroides sp. 1354]MDM1068899.1 response regulator transcription factor [Myroides sp. 1372]